MSIEFIYFLQDPKNKYSCALLLISLLDVRFNFGKYYLKGKKKQSMSYCFVHYEKLCTYRSFTRGYKINSYYRN